MTLNIAHEVRVRNIQTFFRHLSNCFYFNVCLVIKIMSKPTEKKKLYRHSTTFYRKLKKLQFNASEINLEESCNVVAIQPIIPSVEERGEELCTNEATTAAVSTFAVDCDQLVNDIDTTLNYEEESDEILQSFSLWQHLKDWALKHKMTHIALNDLLEILQNKGMELPSDSRTLLKTPRSINITAMGNGEFWYNGLKSNLIECLPMAFKLNKVSLSLIFNVDGVPPFKSAPLEFWPILFRIAELPDIKPMVVAIYCGESKPPLQHYLNRFVDELNEIISDGIIYKNCQMKFKIKYFVCDTPARSFIKGTVGFNAAHGCIKCTVTGKYDKGGRHMGFPQTNCPLRTDEGFRRQIDEDHHKEESPLIKLPINMIEDIIVADSLHLFHLGVMRKCLYGWVYGNYNFKTKLSGKDIDQISAILKNCNDYRPADIHRAIRTFKCLKFWKGSEYRTFLLYLGVVVLKDFLSTEVYHNYLLLFCAVTILSCKTYLKYIHIVQQLLIDFIQQFGYLYGADAISSNIHNLNHVVKDVEKFGCLPEISSYPFENFLGHIKSLVRSGRRPLAQIAKRVIELSNFNSSLMIKQLNDFGSFVKDVNLMESHIIPECSKVYNEVYITKEFMLRNNVKNKWFLTKRNVIVEMINVTYYNGKIHIYGRPFKEISDFFDLPIKSSYLNIYQCKLQNNYDMPKLFSLTDVKCKLLFHKYKQSAVFLPLLHTIDLSIT